MVTKADLSNEDNYSQCECGSFAHNDHMKVDSDGCNVCPECNSDYQTEMINIYKKLLRQLADPELKKSDIDQCIKIEISNLAGLTPEEFDELGLEIN